MGVQIYLSCIDSFLRTHIVFYLLFVLIKNTFFEQYVCVL